VGWALSLGWFKVEKKLSSVPTRPVVVPSQQVCVVACAMTLHIY